jgi:hypothetical protein
VPHFHNIYNVFAEDEDNTVTTNTATMNIAALMRGSTITGEQTATISELVANAINQLSTNQTALINQTAVLL